MEKYDLISGIVGEAVAVSDDEKVQSVDVHITIDKKSKTSIKVSSTLTLKEAK